jgi:hypothetical protein
MKWQISIGTNQFIIDSTSTGTITALPLLLASRSNTTTTVVLGVVK